MPESPSPQYWFPLDRVSVLLRRTMTAPAHRGDPALPATGGDPAPALILLTGSKTCLVSSGVHFPDERVVIVYADCCTPAPCAEHTGTEPAPADGAMFLPLTSAPAGARTLGQQIRSSTERGAHWMVVDAARPQEVAFHERNPHRPQVFPGWESALVSIDEFGPYPALVAVEQSWNGWAVPRFTRPVVERIAADVDRVAAGGHPGDYDRVRITGDRVEIIRHFPDDDANPGVYPVTAFTTDVEVIEPDSDGLYGVGGWMWTWGREDGDAGVCGQHCPCGTGCGCPQECDVCHQPVDAAHRPVCPWSAGSAPYERPMIAAKTVVFDAHRHQPGCRKAVRRPGGLFTYDLNGDWQCTNCAATDSRDVHTVTSDDGTIGHHQRCSTCGAHWSVSHTPAPRT